MSSFKRSGLHRLECDGLSCDGYVYATVSQLELRGLPLCGCSGRYVPAEVELCDLLDLQDAPAVIAYRAEIESIWHGQEPHGRRLGKVTLKDPHELAMHRITTNRAQNARKRRVDALKPATEPLPF